MSESIEAQKSKLANAEAELQLDKENLQLQEEIAALAGEAFAGKMKNQRVQPTLSVEGTPRLRALVLDEDAGLGYTTGTHWIGIAQIDDVIFVERQFPMARKHPVYFTAFNTATGELEQHVEDDKNRGDKPLEGSSRFEGEAKTKIMKQLRYSLRDLSYGTTTDYEKSNVILREKYQFESEHLK